MLIIASIQTLKRGNKKCGKDGIFRWFRYSVDDVTKETFDKLLELLIQKQSSQGCHVRTLQPFWPKGLVSSVDRYIDPLYKE